MRLRGSFPHHCLYFQILSSDSLSHRQANRQAGGETDRQRDRQGRYVLPCTYLTLTLTLTRTESPTDTPDRWAEQALHANKYAECRVTDNHALRHFFDRHADIKECRVTEHVLCH